MTDEQRKPRELFLETCREIAARPAFQHFKVIQKGQIMKYRSVDKDFTFEIYFGSSHYNMPNAVVIDPRVVVSSKSVQTYEREILGKTVAQGICFHGALSEDFPTAGGNQSITFSRMTQMRTVLRISRLLEEKVLPFLAHFEEADKGLHFFREQKDCRLSFPYFLVYGKREDAIAYLQNWLGELPYEQRARAFYKELVSAEVIDVMHNEFYGADILKYAYLAGIPID
ncbi:hypothetical protein [Listeria costaricensis]|uniref:hypothetical protein n=1 Tax=Listeria costaricensis TaxID=2026604 RepID=UPI000C073048|nr:hypothetical protein [Listeria costaricensis]